MFFSVSSIPLVVTNQVEGIGYITAHLQQKSPFYFHFTYCGRFHQSTAPVLRCFFKAFYYLFRDTVDNCILDFTPRILYKFSWLPAFWELFLEALTPLLLTLHVA